MLGLETGKMTAERAAAPAQRGGRPGWHSGRRAARWAEGLGTRCRSPPRLDKVGGLVDERRLGKARVRHEHHALAAQHQRGRAAVARGRRLQEGQRVAQQLEHELAART